MENLAEKLEQPSGPPAKGSLWRLQGIFFQPKETFQEIAQKPTWLIAAILCVIIGSIGIIWVMETIGFENIMMQQAQSQGREMTEEQIQMMNSPTMKAIRYGTMIIGTPIVMLLTAGLLLALFWLIGSDAKFNRVFSVVVHSLFASTIVSTVISALVVTLAPDPTELDIQNLVASHLGAFVSRTESPVLFAALSSVDILTFYYLFLLSLGMSVVGRKSFKASAAMVLVLWLVWVGLKTGGTALFT
ncbi:MAG: YIP1 family protein [Acidobacteriota bacterium]